MQSPTYAGQMARARAQVQQCAAGYARDLQAAAAAAGPLDPALVRQRQPVDGGQVLGYCEQFLCRFARFPSRAALTAAVLWAAHAHARDAQGVLVFDATPRLMFLSSEPGSGKSRALELTGMLCPEVFGLDAEPTEAALVYTISREHATALLDEGDVLFGAGKRKAGIRAVLNAGYTRSGTVLRMRGGKGERSRVFGPVALAGLDVMKTATGDTLAPLFSRSIVIRMRKSADPVPRLDANARRVAGLINQALAAWTASVRDDLASSRTDEIPEWLANRSEEIWAPLLAVAEAAGGNWPELALEACEELVLRADSQDDGGDIMGDLADAMGSWEA